jgi:hypothetical protein
VLPVERVLDPGCLRRRSSISIDPASAQPIHADDQLLPILCRTCPRYATRCALTDHGRTALTSSPAAPARPLAAYLQPYDSVAAEMPAGSVLVWHGFWHGGGANGSPRRRPALDGHCAGHIRQQENQQLGIPREIARVLAAVRQLVATASTTAHRPHRCRAPSGCSTTADAIPACSGTSTPARAER